MPASSPSHAQSLSEEDRSRAVTDSFGTVSVPAGVLWGAQTARSLHFFAIGEQRMPPDITRTLAWIKWASAWPASKIRVKTGHFFLLEELAA